MGLKVCKFGGTSMAEYKTIIKVADIVKSDPDRKFVVVSAPGKRVASDPKITDTLYKCYDEKIHTGKCPSFEIIRESRLASSKAFVISEYLEELSSP
jgi:aspartate kinase